MSASVVLSVSILAVLLLTLGLAITSVAFIQSNTEGGSRCYFFVSKKEAIYSDYWGYYYDKGLRSLPDNYKVQICQLSLASATISTTCIALLTVIELVSVVFQLTPKKYKTL